MIWIKQKNGPTAPGDSELKMNNENDYDYKLVVLGGPKSQGRHRTYTKDKNGKPLKYPLQVDPSKYDKRSLRIVVQDKAPEKPLDCPLELKLVFCFPYRKGDYGTGRNAGILKSSAPKYHTVKPDVDNLIKLIFDALNGIFWRDDTIICKLESEKRYDLRPRTEIYIKEVKEQKQ